MTLLYVNAITVHPPVEGAPLLMNFTVFQEHASTNLLGKKRKEKCIHSVHILVCTAGPLLMDRLKFSLPLFHGALGKNEGFVVFVNVEVEKG